MQHNRFLHLRHARKALTIAAIGPDGSGKTTILDWIEEELAPVFDHRAIRLHLRPHVLPTRGEVARGARDRPDGKPDTMTDEVPQDPYAAPLPGRLWSLVRLGWFCADYALGALARPQAGLVLFDRHVDDLWIDPRRHRLNLPPAVIRAALSPLPRADLTILLAGEAGTVSRRKGEQTVDDVRRQMALLHGLAKGRRDCALLETDTPPDVTRAALRQILAQHFGPTGRMAPPPDVLLGD